VSNCLDGNGCAVLGKRKRNKLSSIGHPWLLQTEWTTFQKVSASRSFFLSLSSVKMLASNALCDHETTKTLTGTWMSSLNKKVLNCRQAKSCGRLRHSIILKTNNFCSRGVPLILRWKDSGKLRNCVMLSKLFKTQWRTPQLHAIASII
jgi:hypothetical protein